MAALRTLTLTVAVLVLVNGCADTDAAEARKAPIDDGVSDRRGRVGNRQRELTHEDRPPPGLGTAQTTGPVPH